MEKFIPKLKNWWWYNKRFVLIALVAAGMFAYAVKPSGESEPDYSVGLITDVPRPAEERQALEDALRALGEDVNGDGEVIVRVSAYGVKLGDESPNAGYNNYEVVAKLDFDLVAGSSGMFFLEDPETFQRVTNGCLTEPFAALSAFPELSASCRADAPDHYAALLERIKAEG